MRWFRVCTQLIANGLLRPIKCIEKKKRRESNTNVHLSLMPRYETFFDRFYKRLSQFLLYVLSDGTVRHNKTWYGLIFCRRCSRKEQTKPNVKSDKLKGNRVRLDSISINECIHTESILFPCIKQLTSNKWVKMVNRFRIRSH